MTANTNYRNIFQDVTNAIRCYIKIMASIHQKIEKAAVELAQCRERFETAQRNFDSLLKLVSEPPKGADEQETPEPNKSSENKNDLGGLTLGDQLCALLRGNPKKEWGYKEISKHLPGVKMPALRVLIWTLKQKGRIVSAGYGLVKIAP